jgi:hypothetical protein
LMPPGRIFTFVYIALLRATSLYFELLRATSP